MPRYPGYDRRTPPARNWRLAAEHAILQNAARRIMRKSVPSIVPMAGGRSGVVRLLLLLGFALALGACSKCDVPDFTHWGSSAAPHACDSDTPRQ